ncbi:TWiK family of potassium channels protein 18-like isoform X2 [Cimex lectularius]|uniref:Potassium channel domain-containing protein n=1 Tax=Cimex lectularius TaxID=79782 RepID=A0A8I6RBX0_CIMLE|nr:TWiK family of potassium channels protein 18-like isoform X2 [Cimex lectularius]
MNQWDSSQKSMDSLSVPNSSESVRPTSPQLPSSPHQRRALPARNARRPRSPYIFTPQSPNLSRSRSSYSPVSLTEVFFPTDSDLAKMPKSPSEKGGPAVSQKFQDFGKFALSSGLSVGERMTFFLHGKLSQLSQKWFTHIFLLVAVVGYTLIGALLYSILEGRSEEAQAKQLLGTRRDVIEQIQQLAIDKDTGLDAKVTQLIRKYESQLVGHYQENSRLLMKGDNELNWNFWSAAFFCGTIYTTLGYGHIVPITTAGRALTIAYAIIGVPLFLTLLADFGKMFTRMIKLMWVYVRRLYYTGSPRKFPKMKQDEGSPDVASSTGYTIDDEFNLPITIALIVFLAYLFIGAIIFYLWEEWSFFESFYFVFISMATIGFGDFVPENQIYMMLSIVYLVFGLALTSMCINVVQEKLSSTFAQASAKLGATIGFDLGEECEVIQVESPLPVKPQSAPASVSTTNPALDITPPKKGILHKGKHTQN